MRIKTITDWILGTVNVVDDTNIPQGSASAALNWITKGDKIELRRGYLILGTEQIGSGQADGVHTAFKDDGTQVLFRKRGRRLEYYDTVTSDWIENGTNIFPAAAVDDQMSFANYQSKAGAQMFCSSPNSSIYKVMVANPGSVTDLLSTAYRGYIKIKQNRTFLWNNKGTTGNVDPTGVYLSYIDNSQYTTVTAEVRHSGNGTTKTFTGTLAFKAGGAKRTCFGVSFTDSAETFTDDFNGVLTGSAGGSGTINYTTGAYSITFFSAPASAANNITSTYQHEDSTNQGLADFSSSPTRTAGQGDLFRQNEGGQIQNIVTIGDTEYCLHQFKSYALTLTRDDTGATNLPFRERVGIPNWRAAVDTGEGIYYIDDTDEIGPQFKLLRVSENSTAVIPVSISRQTSLRRIGGKLVTIVIGIDLTDYRFDKAVVKEWGDYIVFAVRHKNSTENNRMWIYNRHLKSFDLADYYASDLAVYNGALIAGDSTTDTVYELFSGFDDAASEILNSWEGNRSNLDMLQMKKLKRLDLVGEIDKNQFVNVYAAFDYGSYVLIGTIDGSASYVDLGQAITVGSVSLGRNEVGGGSSGISAYHYEKEIRMRSDSFSTMKLKFEATKLGYVSIGIARFRDIRPKRMKLANRYRSTS